MFFCIEPKSVLGVEITS